MTSAKSMTHRRPLVRMAAISMLGLVLALAAAAHSQAKRMTVPGSKVSLDPPAGFVPAERFSGFVNRDSGTSIVVTQMPAPYTKVRPGMTKERFASRGITVRSSETRQINGRETLILSVEQEAHGSRYRKWLVVFGAGANTVLIAGTYPGAAPAPVGTQIRDAVLSARWDAKRAVDRFEGLPYRIVEAGDLKVANRVSNMLMITKGGVPGIVSPAEPLMVVGASLNEKPVGDLEKFARRRLSRTVQITDLKEMKSRVFAVAGMPAYEITAAATDRRTGTKLRIYQLVVSGGKGYFLAQGFVGAEKGPKVLPQFRQIGESLTPVKK